MKNTVAHLLAGTLLSIITISSIELNAQTQDAFSILSKLEKNYVGLEQEGLNTLVAKASVSTFPGADITVYWAREKGLKVISKGGDLGGMTAGPMLDVYLRAAGLGIKKVSEQYKLTKDTVEANVKAVALSDGTKATELTFVPKSGQDVGFEKLVLKVDTEKWVVRQSIVTTKGQEVSADATYEGGLLKMIVSSGGGVNSTIANTFTKTDKFSVPAKQVIEVKGPNIPKEQERVTITYSDVMVNTKIPEDIFPDPTKPGDVPKPVETAAELFKQVQEAMQKGDIDTAKLKSRQIVTYYPNDPVAMGAKMMLERLPK